MAGVGAARASRPLRYPVPDAVRKAGIGAAIGLTVTDAVHGLPVAAGSGPRLVTGSVEEADPAPGEFRVRQPHRVREHAHLAVVRAIGEGLDLAPKGATPERVAREQDAPALERRDRRQRARFCRGRGLPPAPGARPGGPPGLAPAETPPSRPRPRRESPRLDRRRHRRTRSGPSHRARSMPARRVGLPDRAPETPITEYVEEKSPPLGPPKKSRILGTTDDVHRGAEPQRRLNQFTDRHVCSRSELPNRSL